MMGQADADLQAGTDFMLVFRGRLLKCKLVDVVDETHLQFRWYRAPDSEEKTFTLDLINMTSNISEWSIYGYDTLE